MSQYIYALTHIKQENLVRTIYECKVKNLWKFYFDPEGKQCVRHLIKDLKQDTVGRKHS